ncbi:hypothetical protein [Bradyrhizobium sp. PRIMUS42]|uniref:hypothetical protein n=1 Tax=Bradyrhizobium sp. PRIMUS42 TaxID=2908926 RepID=UPI001FF1B0D3|nr:hypothetical protein [Bradyrhizobium sp. PRIMUS42]MCJ9728948.1 hypothetical protein [Bradyrhizobium sp. PRIMUS42]
MCNVRDFFNLFRIRNELVQAMRGCSKSPLRSLQKEFAPKELTVFAPPAGDGELICARCIEIKLRRTIAKLPLGDY